MSLRFRHSEIILMPPNSRIAGSYMVQAGHSIGAVKDILRHKSTRTTEIYARLAEQQAQDTVDAYGEALAEAIKK